MTLRGLLLGAAALLSGCLTTGEPVFDETNSRPVGEIPDFLAFVEAWEGFGGAENSPRELIEEGARGVVVDGVPVVQDGSATYFAVGTLGERPITCVVFADARMEQVAAEHGVTVEIARREGMALDDQPVPVEADGPKPALEAFVRDQFANERLACIAPARPE